MSPSRGFAQSVIIAAPIRLVDPSSAEPWRTPRLEYHGRSAGSPRARTPGSLTAPAGWRSNPATHRRSCRQDAHAAPELLTANLHIRWRALKGTRNRAAHEYHALHQDNLWNALNDDLPAQPARIRGALANPGRGIAPARARAHCCLSSDHRHVREVSTCFDRRQPRRTGGKFSVCGVDITGAHSPKCHTRTRCLVHRA